MRTLDEPGSMTPASVLWRRLDLPGHDSCRVQARNNGYEIRGACVFLAEGRSCHLDYVVLADQRWRTLSAQVSGWLGPIGLSHSIRVDEKARWAHNGVHVPETDGCTDIDFAFSPSTNTLPINRLALAVGETAPVPVAWLTFPEFRLRRLDQRYERVGQNEYHFEATELRFAVDLRVDRFGIVRDYPGLWKEEGE